jgi:hypothetical protein
VVQTEELRRDRAERYRAERYRGGYTVPDLGIVADEDGAGVDLESQRGR